MIELFAVLLGLVFVAIGWWFWKHTTKAFEFLEYHDFFRKYHLDRTPAKRVKTESGRRLMEYFDPANSPHMLVRLRIIGLGFVVFGSVFTALMIWVILSGNSS